jgi:hypothetical protein
LGQEAIKILALIPEDKFVSESKEQRTGDPYQSIEENPQPQPDSDDQDIESDPAVERGERIHTGKLIARAGGQSGHVPGASPSSSVDHN